MIVRMNFLGAVFWKTYYLYLGYSESQYIEKLRKALAFTFGKGDLLQTCKLQLECEYL